MTRRQVQHLGQAAVAAALLIGLTVPATRHIATAVFIAAVLLTVAATIRPDRGKS